MSTLSRQPRFAQTDIAQAATLPFLLTFLQNAVDDIPPWGAAGRAAALRRFVRQEPILSGAFSSMCSKICSLDWQLRGGRQRVARYRDLLIHADDGQGWQSFLSRVVQDYLGTDQGGFIELARRYENGPVEAIYHLDAECIGFTGDVNWPLIYTPKVGGRHSILLTPLDFARIVDMPSPEEDRYGLGFCAVSRALKAARVLLALYTYDEEKLRDMPMPGIVAINGLTMAEVEEAFKLYQAHREAQSQVVFKGLLWLAAVNSPLTPIDVKLTSFASLPENFDREQTFSLYIYTLALVFGVDAREFWPATQTGATKGEAEVQAQKAKGKGFGQLVTALELMFNWHVLPPSIEFAFDRRNDEDDLVREIARGQTIKNVRALWEPPPGGSSGIITTAEARRLLIELQALPDWLAQETATTLHAQDRLPAALPAVALPSLEAKVARADLERGEEYGVMFADGSWETLWSGRYISLPSSAPEGKNHDCLV